MLFNSIMNLLAEEESSPVEVNGIFPNSFNFIVALGTLVIVLFVLYKFLWNPLLAYLDKRQNEIANNYADASDKNKQAEMTVEETRQKLALIAKDGDEIIANAKTAAQKHEQAEKERLGKELAKMRQQNEEQIAQDRLKMLNESNEYVVSSAVAIAKQYLTDISVDNVESSIAKLVKVGE